MISTYAGESVDFLREALLSIVKQSILPSELIVVFDGPVPSEQERVVERVQRLAPFRMFVVRIETNMGRGVARNRGIEAATENLVALMDSDDICIPDRFEKQLSYLKQHPCIDILAGLSEEFYSGTPTALTGKVIKYCPIDHRSIASALKWTNCIANATILFRKSVWQKIGGFPQYRDINEDYLFFYRALKMGAIFACIPEVILRVRITPEQRKRRRGIKLLAADYRFRMAAWKEGHVGLTPTVAMLVLLSVRRLLPETTGALMQFVWRRIGKTIFRH